LRSSFIDQGWRKNTTLFGMGKGLLLSFFLTSN
jgi:hypothetical protein